MLFNRSIDQYSTCAPPRFFNHFNIETAKRGSVRLLNISAIYSWSSKFP